MSKPLDYWLPTVTFGLVYLYGCVTLTRPWVYVLGTIPIAPVSLVLIGLAGMVFARKNNALAFPYVILGCGLFDLVLVQGAGLHKLASGATLLQAALVAYGWLSAGRPKFAQDWSALLAFAAYLTCVDLQVVAGSELPLWVFEGLMWVWLYRTMPKPDSQPINTPVPLSPP